MGKKPVTTVGDIWDQIGVCLGTWLSYPTSRDINPIKIQFTLDNSKVTIDERKNGVDKRLTIRKI